MSHFISAWVGPRLYRISRAQRQYEPNFAESSGDKMFSIGNCLYSACMVISPILVPYIIYTWSPSNYGAALKAAATFYLIAYTLRTIGRLSNKEYNQFINLLNKAKSQHGDADEARYALHKYDYQIFAAPVDFYAKTMQDKFFVSNITRHADELIEPLNSFRKILAWIAANSFGRRMLYPGSLAIFHSLLNAQLIEGRRKIIEERNGNRYIVLTENQNKLDTIFVDNRGKGKNGDKLVICCDGNAGFYELGVMRTPVDLQYSVLGWNLPGFAESTGTPTPTEILISMEAIMQFAIRKLGFQPNQIILHAWSIGGFPATWAAANYPQISALILDASFDDLIPLALARMPSAINGLVRYTVKKHLNLPIAEQLKHYKGPILLIRRWNEEIIVTEEGDPSAKRASNRANFLLLKLIRHRYPGLVSNQEDERCIFEWLEKEPQDRLTDYMAEDSSEPIIQNDDFASMDQPTRERLIQQLCAKYFVDFMDATHNTPLSPEYFNVPK